MNDRRTLVPYIVLYDIANDFPCMLWPRSNRNAWVKCRILGVIKGPRSLMGAIMTPTLPYEGIKTPFNPLGAVRHPRYRRLCGYTMLTGWLLGPCAVPPPHCTRNEQMGRQTRV